MARYSIEDTTLTALGDAIRDKSGKQTKVITVQEEQVVPSVEVSKSMNATGFETHDGQTDFERFWDVISFPKATKIKVKIAYELYNPSHTLQIGIGEAHNSNEFSALSNITKYESTSVMSGIEYQEDIYDSNIITIYFLANASFNKLGFYAECYPLDAEGNLMGDSTIIVDVEKVVPNTMTPLQMASEIEAIDLGLMPPEEAFTLTGDCQYKFATGGWDWFIEQCGDRITTKDITNTQYMFVNSKLENIPFDINGSSGTCLMSYIFQNCNKLTSIPKLNVAPSSASNLFYGCQSLIELSEESVKDINWSSIDNATSSYSGNRSYTFYYCQSLRRFPMSFLAHGGANASNSYSIYYNLFNNCYSLDEVIDLPVVHRKAKWASNAFSYTFNYCGRLKDIIFETNEDGTPIKIDTWSKQAIDLTQYVGYSSTTPGGFTTATQVVDDATYQALKDNPDMWTLKPDYCRYNHDSAVRTINSLPDLSGGAGGNNIYFKGVAGALTDGGAINTLTEEEIAVAAAKGWTVALR